MAANVRHVHFSFFDVAGFQPGDTRTVKLFLPGIAPGQYFQTAVAVTAAPFAAANQNRQLRVVTTSIKAEDPNPGSNNLPTIRVKVESVGPDAPQIWYLNLSLVQ
ncbi:hypothetical protein [Cellulomonas sp. URHB0016]